MKQLLLPSLFLTSLFLTSLLVPEAAFAQLDPEPTRSFERLVTSNGHGVVSFDRATARVDTFLEHSFRFFEPREEREDLCFSADESRDLAYDTYFGVRANGVGTWLTDVPIDEAGYEAGTNIIRVVQTLGDLEIVTRYTMPFGLEQPVLLMSAEVTNRGAAAIDVSTYSLFNFRLGNAMGAREPSVDAEEVAWDEERRTFYEFGPSQGTIAYVAASDVAHATASLGGSGAFESLRRGENLDDQRVTSGPVSDVSPALQSDDVSLAVGESHSFEVAVVWALDEDAGPDVDAFRTWLGDVDGFEKVRSEWTAWHGEGLAATELGLEEDLYLQSQAMLRMGQVRETDGGFGQILASLPPGLGNVDAQWNISWVRDMAYAVAALIRSGHHEEARDALAFQLTAPRGRHVAEVGRPYRISITRYFGNGTEESDCNEDGPNIEFDGFGLFLWTLGMYLESTGDRAFLEEHWEVIQNEIAEVLVSLVDPSGVIQADSSIWEVHYNGKQKRFTYTSLAAIRGLCDASAMAELLGDTDTSARFAETAMGIGGALLRNHTDARGALGQSAEDVLVGSGYLDAATVEAVNWGVVHPEGRVAMATRRALLENLRVETGYGLMRNDDGGWYDSQEWVFVDLRTLPALPVGDDRTQLGQWLTAQARANDLQISELLTADAGAYAGSIPMVGFGAGAYILSTAEPMTAVCGAYIDSDEPRLPDGGVVDGGTTDGGPDGGTRDASAVPDEPSDGCACSSTSSPGSAWLAAWLAAVLLGLAWRSRR